MLKEEVISIDEEIKQKLTDIDVLINKRKLIESNIQLNDTINRDLELKLIIDFPQRIDGILKETTLMKLMDVANKVSTYWIGGFEISNLDIAFFNKVRESKSYLTLMKKFFDLKEKQVLNILRSNYEGNINHKLFMEKIYLLEKLTESSFNELSKKEREEIGGLFFIKTITRDYLNIFKYRHIRNYQSNHDSYEYKINIGHLNYYLYLNGNLKNGEKVFVVNNNNISVLVYTINDLISKNKEVENIISKINLEIKECSTFEGNKFIVTINADKKIGRKICENFNIILSSYFIDFFNMDSKGISLVEKQANMFIAMCREDTLRNKITKKEIVSKRNKI